MTNSLFMPVWRGPKTAAASASYIAMAFKNIGVSKSRSTAVHMGKYMQVMILTIAFITVVHVLTTVNVLSPLLQMKFSSVISRQESLKNYL